VAARRGSGADCRRSAGRRYRRGARAPAPGGRRQRRAGRWDDRAALGGDAGRRGPRGDAAVCRRECPRNDAAWRLHAPPPQRQGRRNPHAAGVDRRRRRRQHAHRYRRDRVDARVRRGTREGGDAAPRRGRQPQRRRAHVRSDRADVCRGTRPRRRRPPARVARRGREGGIHLRRSRRPGRRRRRRPPRPAGAERTGAAAPSPPCSSRRGRAASRVRRYSSRGAPTSTR
jgi:hypothetical protein